MQEDLIDRLEALVIGNPDFEEVERAFGGFCPFEAMRVEKHEIRHSNFLAYYINPNRPHGFGTECLKAMMRSVAKAYRQWPSALDERAITPLDFHVMDFEGAGVHREWRSVDLLVELPDRKMIVALELKIDAREHGNQLQRYRDTVEEAYPERDGWHQILVYLTKTGSEPSETGEGWFALELAEVAREFDRVVAGGGGTDAARAYLGAYLAMLRRHHLPNERLDDLAAKLWDQHREALLFLMDRSPQGGSGIFGRLYEQREQLARDMSAAAGTTVVLDDSTRTILRFAVPAWDTVPNMLSATGWTGSKRVILIELAPSNGRDAIRMRFVLGPADPTIRQLFYLLLEKGGLKSKRQQITTAWTRIANETLVAKLNESEQDPDTLTADVVRKAIAYMVREVPKATAALRLESGEAP
jgi:hypothetical protein